MLSLNDSRATGSVRPCSRDCKDSQKVVISILKNPSVRFAFDTSPSESDYATPTVAGNNVSQTVTSPTLPDVETPCTSTLTQLELTVEHNPLTLESAAQRQEESDGRPSCGEGLNHLSREFKIAAIKTTPDTIEMVETALKEAGGNRKLNEAGGTTLNWKVLSSLDKERVSKTLTKVWRRDQ